MSKINQRVLTQGQITTDYDLSKIFLLNNRYENDNDVNNSGYGSLNLLVGTVMGRVTATGSLVPCTATAVDGSQFPIGVLAQDLLNVLSGQTVLASLCIAGDVAAEQLIFLYGDTLDTVVSGRRMRDQLQGGSAGIIIRFTTNMTDFDN